MSKLGGSLPYGPQLPVTDTTSGPRAPDLEFLMFPMAIIDYGHGFPPRGNYGISVARPIPISLPDTLLMSLWTGRDPAQTCELRNGRVADQQCVRRTSN